MVKVFVDTNVLIDFLLPERDKHMSAAEFFTPVLEGRVEVAISTQSILDAIYICQKTKGSDTARMRIKLLYLRESTNIDAIDPFEIEKALRDSNPDIEDSAQIAFAYDNVCDFIITNDAKLLKRELPAPLKAMTPEAFIERCKA